MTHAASPVSLTVNATTVTLTGSLSPSATVGVTNTYLVGAATPGATVTNTVDTWPDGTTHGPYSATANGSGTYSMGPYILQQLGTYHETIHDSISGQTINITYSGTGDFSASANTTTQTVTKGNSASYTVTFSSVNGFAGTVVPAALNWSQVPGATGSWSPLQVTVPSGGSVQAVFTIQTSSSTTAGTYSNITLQGANGSVTHAASPASLTVSAGTVTLTGSLSPSNATVGVTNAYLVGNATPGATVTNTVDTWPDGTIHGPYSATANGSGAYSMGPYILQQLGSYQETIHDSISGQTINIAYGGTGDFSASANTTTQTVTKGNSASYTVTFSSVNGFAGTVVPAALNWSQVPGATGSWSPLQVTVPSGGSVQAVFTIQTSSSTTAGTYSNITLQGANGSVTHGAPLVEPDGEWRNDDADRVVVALQRDGRSDERIPGRECNTGGNGYQHCRYLAGRHDSRAVLGHSEWLRHLQHGAVHLAAVGYLPRDHSRLDQRPNDQHHLQRDWGLQHVGERGQPDSDEGAIGQLHGDIQQRVGVCRDGRSSRAELVTGSWGYGFVVAAASDGSGGWVGAGGVHDPDFVEHDGRHVQQHHFAGGQRISDACRLAS